MIPKGAFRPQLSITLMVRRILCPLVNVCAQPIYCVAAGNNRHKRNQTDDFPQEPLLRILNPLEQTAVFIVVAEIVFLNLVPNLRFPHLQFAIGCLLFHYLAFPSPISSLFTLLNLTQE